jgi:thioredoxin 1
MKYFFILLVCFLGIGLSANNLHAQSSDAKKSSSSKKSKSSSSKGKKKPLPFDSKKAAVPKKEKGQTLHELNTLNFEKVALKSKLPVLVFFYNENCPDCQSTLPALSKIAKEQKGKFFVAQINGETHTKPAAKYGVRTYPTVMLFRAGDKINQLNGAQTEAQIRTLLTMKK